MIGAFTTDINLTSSVPTLDTVDFHGFTTVSIGNESRKRWDAILVATLNAMQVQSSCKKDGTRLEKGVIRRT